MIRAGWLAVAAVMLLAPIARAEPAEPSGPHPRMFLDDARIERLRTVARNPESGTARAIVLCRDAGADPDKYRKGGFQGMAFASVLTSCALAWQITHDATAAATGVRYFRAVLDDFQEVGDGAGGDDVVRHNTGYAMRSFAPAAALAYDWMHDAPGVDETLLALARERFQAWADWYRTEGYLRDVPGANYHAGYAFGTAMIAIAQGGEAGGFGQTLWLHAIDLYTEIAAATEAGGVLEGGDWPEGWQYGPLSVIEYALGARALADSGVDLPAFRAWSEGLMARYVHALLPDRVRWYVGGDTGEHEAHIASNPRVLYAVIAGVATDEVKAWARAELAHSPRDAEREMPVLAALAEAEAGKRVDIDRAATSYLAAGSGNFYVRSGWGKEAIWMVANCSPRRVPDHQHLAAGTFELTRGNDDLIVDPTPYGSHSSLTSNAPTVESPQLPEGYRPSQAPWGKATRFERAGQGRSGVAVARCNYADQYRFKEQPSDVALAMRDFALVPAGRSSAALVIWDRARTGDAERGLHLRFRTPLTLTEHNGAVTGRAGDSALSIRSLGSGAAPAQVRAMPTGGNCWDVAARGRCEFARIPGDEMITSVAGPEPSALHLVIASAAGDSPALSRIDSDRATGVSFVVDGQVIAVVQPRSASRSLLHRSSPRPPAVAGDAPLARFTYTGPAAATHVIAGAPGTRVTARPAAGGCEVTLSGSSRARPELAVVHVDRACRASLDDAMSVAASGAPALARPPRTGSSLRAARGCACAGASGGTAAVWFVVPLVALWWARRRRPSTRG